MNYLLSITILLFALWPAYYLVLKYSGRYTLNRVLLLLAIVVVGALPFLKLSSPAPVMTQSLHGTIEYVEQQVELEEPTYKENLFIINDDGEKEALLTAPVKPLNTLPIAYAFGCLLMVLLFVIRLLFLLAMHLRSRPEEHGRFRLLRPGAQPGQAFTFGRQLYFSQELPNDPDFGHILAHEQVHARQLHSLDILLSELFLCAFWFHPAAWWLRSKMRANLEFLVDASIVRSGGNRRDYQLALVRQSQNNQGLALALPFSEPSLKSRITRMGGMTKYRLIGLVAAIALFFWMGVAVTVLQGNPKKVNDSLYPDQVTYTVTNTNRPISATEFLYATYFAQPLPEEINTFELHFRRLPTPDEYAQIKSILQHLPHTNFSIYQPCHSDAEGYVMQLSHFLQQEAVFGKPLREGEILPNHFVFQLNKREVETTTIPDDLPLRSYGYYSPTISSASYRIEEVGNERIYTDATGSYPISHSSSPPPAGQYHFEGLYRPEIADETLAVFINGKRFALLEKPEVKYDGQFQHAGYAKKNLWVSIENTQDAPLGYPLSLAQLEDGLPHPPNARMACLLGMEKNVDGMVRRLIGDDSRGHMNNNPTTFLKSYIGSHKMHSDQTISYYLNDQQVTEQELLGADLSDAALIQVGWNKNEKGHPMVLQAITDMTWR